MTNLHSKHGIKHRLMTSLPGNTVIPAFKEEESTKITGQEIALALGIKMTGPKATRPSYRCLRKTVLRVIRGGKSSSGSWRTWPKEKTI